MTWNKAGKHQRILVARPPVSRIDVAFFSGIYCVGRQKKIGPQTLKLKYFRKEDGDMHRVKTTGKAGTLRSFARLFVLLAMTGFAGLAQAEGWYMGLNVGNARATDYFDNSVGVSSPVVDESDTAWRLYGGYHVYDIMAIEFGYVDFGKNTVTGTLGGSPYSDKNEARGLDALIVGTMGMTDNISALGKIGFVLYNVDSETTQLGVTTKTSDTGLKLNKFTYGAGAKYAFGKKYAMRVEWQRYRAIGDDADTGRSHYEMFSLGLMVNL